MRSKKTKTTTIAVEIGVADRVEEDRKRFQEKIKGGKWSKSDAIKEYQKILNGDKKNG